jgi:ABC-type spermidine/putrescine transport system permease subunit I
VAADGALIRLRAAARKHGLRERIQGLVMVLPPVAVVAVFIGFPVGAAIAYTLGRTGGPNSVIAELAQRQHVAQHGVTLAAYREMLSNSRVREDIWVTIWITLVTVAVVLAVSWSIALYARLAGGRLARALSSLAVVPLFIPVVIASYAILTFYASDGFLRSVSYHLGYHGFPTLGYTLTAIVIGEIWVNVPFGVLMMTSGLSSVPDGLIEAARDAGASLPRTVWSVLLPLNVIPTVITATFTAIYALGSFTVPYLVGPTAPNMLGPTMQNYFSSFNQPQQAQVLAMIVFVLAAGVGTVYVWANVRSAKRAGQRR